ncbi:MAG: hypothetical protein WCG92_08385 [Hyphomicrobiales bacterium]
MAKRTTRKKPNAPRPDKMVGPVKYKRPTGDAEPSMLEIASMRKKKKVVKKKALKRRR